MPLHYLPFIAVIYTAHMPSIYRWYFIWRTEANWRMHKHLLKLEKGVMNLICTTSTCVIVVSRRWVSIPIPVLGEGILRSTSPIFDWPVRRNNKSTQQKIFRAAVSTPGVLCVIYAWTWWIKIDTSQHQGFTIILPWYAIWGTKLLRELSPLKCVAAHGLSPDTTLWWSVNIKETLTTDACMSCPIEGPDRSVSKPSFIFVFVDLFGSGSKIYRSKDL
jgi:hypothetical protein